ncbi:3472_t:CDS:2, partial [Acaulospora morrowiae]
TMPPSPLTQQPSQPPQSQPPRLTQQKQIHPLSSQHVMNPSIMDIDSLPGTSPKIIPRPVSDVMSATSVGIGGLPPRQITPIAPANQNNLLSSIVINKMQSISGIRNPNLPETPASLSLLELDDGDRQLLSKRKIQQLVDQIDPKERLEPEVEDVCIQIHGTQNCSSERLQCTLILLEIADEFISSVSSFACLLAKHRKSDTLEVKDLQLHLERNWNIRIPGFASDEIRSVRKTIPNAHQQKLLAVNTAKANKAQIATMAPT